MIVLSNLFMPFGIYVYSLFSVGSLVTLCVIVSQLFSVGSLIPFINAVYPSWSVYSIHCSLYSLVMGSEISFAVTVCPFLILGSLILLCFTVYPLLYICSVIPSGTVVYFPSFKFGLCDDHLIRIVGGNMLISCKAVVKRVRCLFPFCANVCIINYLYSTLIVNRASASKISKTIFVFMPVIWFLSPPLMLGFVSSCVCDSLISTSTILFV